MSIVEIISIFGVCLIGIGFIVTWVRNNKSQAKYMTEMETRQNERIKTVFNKLDDPNNGLGAIKKAVDKQQVNCARISSGFQERIKSLEDR